MISRRRFIQNSSLCSASILFYAKVRANNKLTMSKLIMPDESALHERTWMAFVANDTIWSARQIPEVKRNLTSIAKTIAKYEPVSILVAPADYDEAFDLLEGLNNQNYPIELVEIAIDDLWLRDTGPTFVNGTDNKKYAINFNFNGWGGKQDYDQDAKVAEFIAKQSGAVMVNTDLILEGGCFEVDGHGTALLTKSSVINDNRNPDFSQTEIEEELKYLLGLEKIIWLDGIKGKDITDAHIDFYARFSKPGEVVVSRENHKSSYDYEITRENIEVLSHATDAKGQGLTLHIIDTPETFNEKYGVNDFAAGYIGYYVCNGAVIAQKFGDKHADKKAKATLETLFPDRVIEQIVIDGIASGGGSIHCATQQEPKI